MRSSSNTDGRVDLVIVFPNNRKRAFGALADEIAAITPPVQDGLVASFLRGKGFTVQCIDADAEGLLPSELVQKVAVINPLCVLISSDQVNSGDVTKMAAAGETAKALKKDAPLIPVVMYGIVPSAYPEKVLTEEGPDMVCQGEPFKPMEILLSLLRKSPSGVSLENNEIKGIWAKYGDKIVTSEHAGFISDIDSLPLTAWDMLPPARYRAHHWHCFDRLNARSPYAAIFTNMGCPYNCTFCSVNVMAGKPNVRFHGVDYIMSELSVLVDNYKVSNIRILDNVFTLKPEIIETLCDRIIERWQGLNLWAYARVDTIKSKDLLKKMKLAGINWLAYGFESANEKVRKAIHKAPSDARTGEVIEWTREAGINIVANFIFGLPEDDRDSMTATLNMAKAHNFEWANFYCAMAYPGTALYDASVRAGTPLPDKWSGYSQYSPDSMPMPTSRLTSREVRAFRDNAFKDYYGSSVYLSMIERKFGVEASAMLKRILSMELKRN